MDHLHSGLSLPSSALISQANRAASLNNLVTVFGDDGCTISTEQPFGVSVLSPTVPTFFVGDGAEVSCLIWWVGVLNIESSVLFLDLGVHIVSSVIG